MGNLEILEELIEKHGYELGHAIYEDYDADRDYDDEGDDNE